MNLTQEQVSQICGIDEITYSKMECGFAEVPFELVYKLAKFYNVEPNRLLNETAVSNIYKPTTSDERKKSSQDNEQIGSALSKENSYKNIWNVLSLCVSALLLTWYFVIPIYTGRIEFYGNTYQTLCC